MEEDNMIKSIINKIKEIVLSPADFWTTEKEKEYGRWTLFSGFYLPLVLVASVAVFLGAWFGSTHFYMGYALLKALRELVLFVLLYFIAVYLINQLLHTFEGSKDLPSVRKLVVFSLSPYLLISVITGLFPSLYVVDVLGLYSAYLFWTGSGKLLSLPERKQSGFILISVLLCLFVFGFLSIMLWKIFVAYY